MKGTDYLDPDNIAAAEVYVNGRGMDALALYSQLRWDAPTLRGCERCEVYGHSIALDREGVLHDGHKGLYEVRRRGEAVEDAGLTLAQVIAWLLATHW